MTLTLCQLGEHAHGQTSGNQMDAGSIAKNGERYDGIPAVTAIAQKTYHTNHTRQNAYIMIVRSSMIWDYNQETIDLFLHRQMPRCIVLKEFGENEVASARIANMNYICFSASTACVCKLELGMRWHESQKANMRNASRESTLNRCYLTQEPPR